MQTERPADAVREMLERELKEARAEAEAAAAELSSHEAALGPLRARASKAQVRLAKLKSALQAYLGAPPRGRPKWAKAAPPRSTDDDGLPPGPPTRVPAGFLGDVLRALPPDGSAVTVDEIIATLSSRGIRGQRKTLLAALSVLHNRMRVAARPDRGRYARIYPELDTSGAADAPPGGERERLMVITKG